MSAFDPKRTYAKYAPLPQRDHQAVEVGGDDQSGLPARQRQHRAILVGQYDPTRAGADRNARAGRAVDAINIGRPPDVADGADKIGSALPYFAISNARTL